VDGARPIDDNRVIPIEQQIRARLDALDYPQAFELLMSHFQHKVFRLAYSILGSEALAEETAQDIFIRVWKSLGSYRGQSSISTWIYSIARNTCLTALRNSVAKRTISLESAGVQKIAERRESVSGPGHSGLDWELLLSQLPENYRSVVALFYMEDKSYQEVARMLDLPIGTVKTHLHRARKQLATAVIEANIKKGVF
jgi:RNA polymerase sigma-70 factor (ECF subfamily)